MCSIVDIEHMSWMHEFLNLIYASCQTKPQTNPNLSKSEATQRNIIAIEWTKYFSYNLHIHECKQANKQKATLHSSSPRLNLCQPPSFHNPTTKCVSFAISSTHIFLNNNFQDILCYSVESIMVCQCTRMGGWLWGVQVWLCVGSFFIATILMNIRIKMRWALCGYFISDTWTCIKTQYLQSRCCESSGKRCGLIAMMMVRC